MSHQYKCPSLKNATLGSVLISSLIAPMAATADVVPADVERIKVAGKRISDLEKQESIATKMDVSLKDTGRSIAVLDSDALKMRAISDVREAFNYVAGFRGNGPADRTYTARGVRSSIDNVMVDGLRSLQGGEGGTGSRLPTVFNAEATTFLRGPAALLYGSGITGGIVNITTKKPSEMAQTTVGIKNRSYVSSDTGNFKRNDLSFNIDSTGPLAGDDVLYRIIAQHTPSGDHFQKQRELEETLVDAALTFNLGENTSLTPRFELSDRTRTGGSGYADGVFESNFASGNVTNYGEPINRGEYYGGSDDKGENESKSVSVLLKHEFNDAWKLSANVRHSTTESQALDLYISDSSALKNEVGKDAVERKWVYSAGDDSYDLYDIAAQGKFTTGSVKHHLLAGYSYRDLDISFVRNFQNSDDAVGKNTISASNPSQQIVGAIPVGFMDKEPTLSNVKDTNLYVKDRISLGDVTIVAGAAYIDSGSYDDVVWDLGTVYKLTSDINLFATYSRAFEPVKQSSILKYGQGRTDYDPVSGNNYEIGLKGDFFDNDLSTSITFFILDRENSTKYERNDQGWLLTQISGKSFESKGIEIDTTVHFNDTFNSTFSYAFTRAYDTIGEDKGVQASNVPKHSLAVWNSAQVDENLSFGLGIRYESERNDGNYTLESYVEADLGAYYSVDQWDVSLVLNNAFDKNRAEAGANWVTVQPNTPRALNLSVNYTF